MWDAPDAREEMARGARRAFEGTLDENPGVARLIAIYESAVGFASTTAQP